jgi:hypothetical protein
MRRLERRAMRRPAEFRQLRPGRGPIAACPEHEPKPRIVTPILRIAAQQW